METPIKVDPRPKDEFDAVFNLGICYIKDSDIEGSAVVHINRGDYKINAHSFTLIPNKIGFWKRMLMCWGFYKQLKKYCPNR